MAKIGICPMYKTDDVRLNKGLSIDKTILIPKEKKLKLNLSFLLLLKKLCIHFIEKFVFIHLNFKYRKVLSELKPLAEHLELLIFPLLRDNKIKWLSLEIGDDHSERLLHGFAGSQEYTFPSTCLIVDVLDQRGVKRICLDTQLESNQIMETFLILLYAGPELASAHPAESDGKLWSRKSVADSLLNKNGYHKFCTDCRFNQETNTFTVEYTYCELIFSFITRKYLTSLTKHKDHRALFSLSRYVPVIVFLLFLCSEYLVYYRSYFGLSISFIFYITVCAILWFVIKSIGSLLYNREHKDALVKAYVLQIESLSRFPEVNPHLIFKLDLEGNVLYSNPTAKNMSKHLVCGHTSELLPQNIHPFIQQYIQQTKEHAEKERITAERHLRGRTIEYVFNLFLDEKAIVASGHDVTHLRNVEFQLRQLNQNLELLVNERTDELNKTKDVTIMCLASLAETRDPETGKHLERTCLYIKILSKALQTHPDFAAFLTDENIETVYKSAPLHDIGKVGVPDHILLKPGKLTDEEFAEMKKHTLYGGDALRKAEERLGTNSFLRIAGEITYYHHERWDGKGYPFNLKGEDIPIPARLMSLADVYDALTSKRPYKEAFSHEKTKRIILEGNGSQFDPRMIEAFLKTEDQFIQVSQQLREDSEDKI